MCYSRMSRFRLNWWLWFIWLSFVWRIITNTEKVYNHASRYINKIHFLSIYRLLVGSFVPETCHLFLFFCYTLLYCVYLILCVGVKKEQRGMVHGQNISQARGKFSLKFTSGVKVIGSCGSNVCKVLQARREPKDAAALSFVYPVIIKKHKLLRHKQRNSCKNNCAAKHLRNTSQFPTTILNSFNHSTNTRPVSPNNSD